MMDEALQNSLTARSVIKDFFETDVPTESLGDSFKAEFALMKVSDKNEALLIAKKIADATDEHTMGAITIGTLAFLAAIMQAGMTSKTQIYAMRLAACRFLLKTDTNDHENVDVQD